MCSSFLSFIYDSLHNLTNDETSIYVQQLELTQLKLSLQLLWLVISLLPSQFQSNQTSRNSPHKSEKFHLTLLLFVALAFPLLSLLFGQTPKAKEKQLNWWVWLAVVLMMPEAGWLAGWEFTELDL